MYDSEWCGCKTVIEESIIILSIDRLHYTIGQRRIKPEIETHEECLAMCFDSVLLLSLDCILRFRLFSKHVSNVRMNKNVIAFHSFDGHWIFMPCEWRQWPWTLCPTLNKPPPKRISMLILFFFGVGFITHHCTPITTINSTAVFCCGGWHKPCYYYYYCKLCTPIIIFGLLCYRVALIRLLRRRTL